MSSPPPPLPEPSFLQRPAGSDPEVRAWVSLAQETVAALQEALRAATVRAEAAEGRLGEPRSAPAGVGMTEIEMSEGIGGTVARVEPTSAAADAHARFQAAVQTASAVMAEARAVLREAQDVMPRAQTLPAPAMLNGATAVDSSPLNIRAAARLAPLQPATTVPGPRVAAPGPPEAVEPRSQAADGAVDAGSVLGPPGSPSPTPRPGLLGRRGRRRRT